MKSSYEIAALSGDGVEFDVTEEAVRVLNAVVATIQNLSFTSPKSRSETPSWPDGSEMTTSSQH